MHDNTILAKAVHSYEENIYRRYFFPDIIRDTRERFICSVFYFLGVLWIIWVLKTLRVLG